MRIQEEADHPTWSDDVLELSRSDPLYFTAYRAYLHLFIRGELVTNPVPFIHRMWFLPAILLYVLYKRVSGIVSPTRSITGHVFCCTSTSGYKSAAFFDLVDHFKAAGKSVTLYATEECKDIYLGGEGREDTKITTFNETFEQVPLTQLIKQLPSLWKINNRISKILEWGPLRYKIIVLSALVVEYIKFMALRESKNRVDSYHTYAPMPYQLKSIAHDSIYCYQHGIQSTEGDRASAIPKYAPINYFIYGEYWRESFERKAHPQSPITSVGSPRFDALFDRRNSLSKDIDLLFVSYSHILKTDLHDEAEYKPLVDEVVRLSEKNQWNLKIKLHPTEDRYFYEKWGYDHYVAESDDIVELLLRSEIAVTDASSAFLESIVVGTPMIVTQQAKHIGLEELQGIPGLIFCDEIDEIEAAVGNWKGRTAEPDGQGSHEVVNVGSSLERIIDIVTA